MSEMPQPNFFKALEARIALALAKASAAAAGLASLAHHASVVNGSTIGPSGTLVSSASSFTPASGKVLILATAVVAAGGGTLVAGDNVTGVLLRDGVAIAGSASPFSNMAAEGTTVCSSLFAMWIDSVTAGTAHVWAIEALVGGGHTGAIAPNQSSITLLELP